LNVRAELRSKLVKNNVLQVMGAHNGLGARLIQKHGFDAVWASGFEISASHAKPDANILTMTEFLSAVEQMTESQIPVIADCDTGFGDLNNVRRMVKEYEKANVSAICIEDKLFPKTNSFIPGRQKLETIERFCEKIYAAQQTKIDQNFMVIARIESLIAGEGLENALERAHAYKNAGADMILIHSKKSNPKEIFEFCNRWNSRLPVAIVPTTYPDVTISDLHKNKIKMVIYANQALRAAIKAMDSVLETLKKDGTIKNVSPQLTSMEEIFELQGMNDMILFEQKVKTVVSDLVNVKSF
jgi:phosphoenolpyruvate phosphomutase